MKVVWMFAGQGSQYYAMGRELYEQEPVFREVFDQGDRVVQSLLGISLAKTLYVERGNRFEAFTCITETHPAIFLVEYALAQLLFARGSRPDELLGYSLGEYAAMAVSGMLDFEEALVAVIKQALLLEYTAKRGGMATVLEAPSLMDRSPELFPDCELAGIHFPKSFVVAARGDAITKSVLPGLKERGINAIGLPVDYPFHSSWMDSLLTPSQAILDSLSVRPARIPLLSASSGERVAHFVPGHLWEATRRPIDFPKMVGHLEACGPWYALDLGPSGGMATAVKYNLAPGSPSRFHAIMTPYGNERRRLEQIVQGS